MFGGFSVLLLLILHLIEQDLAGPEKIVLIVPMVGMSLYEASMYLVIRRSVRAGRTPPRYLYLNSIIEITFSSITIWQTAAVVDPLFGLTGPPSLIYIGFLMLVTLELNVRLSIFAGLLTAAQFMVIVVAFLPSIAAAYPPEFPYANLSPHMIRALAYLSVGVVSAVITWEIQRRTRTASHEVIRRQRVMELFGQQVSPEVVDRLLNQERQDEGEVRNVCIMFLDIRDFTRFSEAQDPQAVIAYLNTLFGTLIESINTHNGIINKFLGDGFMAVFGAPLSDGRDSRNAVAAALDIIDQVAQLIDSGQIPPTRIGIGLHAGEVVTGNVGSARRREYTVIGDVVNTASRIEGLNKQFESQILLSREVLEGLREAIPDGLVELEPVMVKGRQQPLTIYRLR